LDVERNRAAIHNWVRKTNLQPTSDEVPNQIALDETVIRINDEQFWLYAAVDPETNKFLHVRLFQTRTAQLTLLFLHELRPKQQVEQDTFDAVPLPMFFVSKSEYVTVTGYPEPQCSIDENSRVAYKMFLAEFSEEHLGYCEGSRRMESDM
jgi:hypothetical protein